MTESSYPAPGVTELQHERLLGRALPSGLLGSPSDDPLIYADGVGTREIRVRASRQAVVDGYGWQNDASVVTKTLSANASGSTRVDLVVLRLDRTTWDVTVEVVEGTPGAGAPSATRDASTGDGTGVYEIELATVTVADGATTLAASTVAEKGWYLGEDGQILCTSTTRPPHQAGRSAWETDTARWILSNGTDWISTVDDTGWVSVSPASGWSANTLRIRQRGGVVYLHVDVNRTGASLAASTTSKLCTIPSGYRLSSGQLFAAAVIYHGKVGRISVSSAGAVNLSNHEGINTGQYLVSSASWPNG